MYAFITISNVGSDAGPFNLYSDVDGFVSAFETDITTAQLEAGFFTDNVPDGTLEIRIQNANELCGTFKVVGTTPLLYYFIASNSQPDDRFTADFVDKGTYAFVYGAFKGYWNGSYEVPGNHLVKLNTDLSVETSFDILEGFNDHIIYIGARLVEISDGSVLLVGWLTSFNGENFNRIIKLNPDGTVNEVFNIGTGFNNYTTAISETTDGKYYIGGIYSAYNGVPRNRIIRLLNNGSIDIAFNIGTGFNNSTLSIITNFDNSLYVSGYFSVYNGNNAPGIIKLKPDGSVDTSFNPGVGFQPRRTYAGVLMDRIPGEEKIVCISYVAYPTAPSTYQGVDYGNIVKLNEDGSVDAEFAANSGTGFNGNPGLINVVFGNKILITSTAPLFTEYNGTPTNGLVLLNADGTLLQAFTKSYGWVYTIGNNMYGTDLTDGLNRLIYVFGEGLVTTTTTTTV